VEEAWLCECREARPSRKEGYSWVEKFSQLLGKKKKRLPPPQMIAALLDGNCALEYQISNETRAHEKGQGIEKFVHLETRTVIDQRKEALEDKPSYMPHMDGQSICAVP
jgi:hypothetical protein